MPQQERLKTILEWTRDSWDRSTESPTVRKNFKKVCECRTPALGGEVYYSPTDGERIFHHTCKSKCCPSCGNRATQLWQRDQWALLPDIPFVGVVLTMPDVLWPVFKDNRRLEHDLPVLGAAAVEAWAWSAYQVKLCVVVVKHTFGGHLNYNPHLHLMVPGGRLSDSGPEWLRALDFDKETIMSFWRFAIIEYSAPSVADTWSLSSSPRN